MKTNYTKDPEENWYIREDVAGYEYPESDNYRLGIVREVIQTQDDIAPLFDILNTPFNQHIKINIAHAIITKALLQSPSGHLQLLLATDVESIMSLEDSGNRDLTDCYHVIFSRNHISRQTANEGLLQELANAERVFSNAKTKPFDPNYLDSVKEAYSFKQITAESDPSMLEQYSSLTKTVFDYRPGDRGYLKEDTIFVVAVAKQNRHPFVVGGAFALHDETYLKRNGQDIVLNGYEILGAVVQEEHKGKGLYKGISFTLLQLLSRQAKPIDIVFSHANIQENAILAVAAQMGETLAIETAQQLHVAIKPSTQQYTINGKYVDDIVVYIPGNQLRRLYSSAYGK